MPISRKIRTLLDKVYEELLFENVDEKTTDAVLDQIEEKLEGVLESNDEN